MDMNCFDFSVYTENIFYADLKKAATVFFFYFRAERLPYAVAFNLSSYLKREENLVPVMALAQEMNFLRSLLSSSNKYGLLKVLLLDFH